MDEEGQEVQGRQELVIPAQGGVVVARVMDETVGAILQALQGDGWPLHVLEHVLEAFSVLGLEPSPCVDVEARVTPRTKELDALGSDLPPLEHHLEGALAEEFFQGCKIDVVGSGVEVAFAIEYPKGHDRVEVRVEIGERPEGLRGDATISRGCVTTPHSE